MITLKQLIEILEPGEWLEIHPQGEKTLAIYGGQEPQKNIEPYLDWKCSGLASASLDSVGVSVVPPDERKDDGKKE